MRLLCVEHKLYAVFYKAAVPNRGWISLPEHIDLIGPRARTVCMELTRGSRAAEAFLHLIAPHPNRNFLPCVFYRKGKACFSPPLLDAFAVRRPSRVAARKQDGHYEQPSKPAKIAHCVFGTTTAPSSPGTIGASTSDNGICARPNVS